MPLNKYLGKGWFSTFIICSFFISSEWFLLNSDMNEQAKDFSVAATTTLVVSMILLHAATVILRNIHAEYQELKEDYQKLLNVNVDVCEFLFEEETSLLGAADVTIGLDNSNPHANDHFINRANKCRDLIDRIINAIKNDGINNN